MISLEATEASVRRTAAIGSSLALAGALSYGVNIAFARLCAQLGLTGADMIVYRAFAIVAIMAPLAYATGRSLYVEASGRPMLLRFAACSAATGVFYLTSLQYLPVALAVTLFYTFPLVVMALTPIVDGQRLPARRWLAGAAAFAGVVVAVGPAYAELDWRGLALALLGSLSCAGMFIVGSRLTADSVSVFFWTQVLGGVVALGVAFSGRGLAGPEAIAAALWPLLISGGCFLIGFMGQILAGKRISASASSLLFLLEPVFAIAVAALVIGETISPLQGLGVAIVVGALAFDLLPCLRPVRTPPAQGLR